jgi:hypothetical protein
MTEFFLAGLAAVQAAGDLFEAVLSTARVCRRAGLDGQ